MNQINISECEKFLIANPALMFEVMKMKKIDISESEKALIANPALMFEVMKMMIPKGNDRN